MQVIFVFFFQAEDGIRDKLVTGVQTCALPISRPCARCLRRAAAPWRRRLRGFGAASGGTGAIARAKRHDSLTLRTECPCGTLIATVV